MPASTKYSRMLLFVNKPRSPSQPKEPEVIP